MGASSILAWQLLARKEKYWAKTLSDDALWDNTAGALGVFDWLRWFSDITLSDTIFSSLISLINFGIPPTEIEPWNVVYEVELPAPDEFVKGVLLKVKRGDVSACVPGPYDTRGFIDRTFTPPVAEVIKSSLLEKGYYGVSRYGQAYYDPQAVRDFLRTTVYFMFKAPVDLATAREKIASVADSLDIAPEIAEDLFNRLSLVTAVKEYAATFDYAWFDYSYFSNAEDDTVVYVDYSLQPTEVEYVDLFDATSACFFDSSFFDYCFFTEPAQEYQHPFRPDDVLLQIRDCVHNAFVRTLPSTGLLVGNYTLPEERARFTPSPRLEVYALS
ncbi:hypothetical protein, partial [Thermogladius sp.]|uniref:hypothetical protein n=1 Tax=Thermogladius sp. TaxID=2023064 RepID=UPI003D108488